MKPNTYHVLSHCIEQGVQFGLNRAFKHDDNPTREVIEEHLERELMNAIHEWFTFDSNED